MGLGPEVSTRKPSLAEVFRNIVEAYLADLRIWLPAKVVAWNESTQTADCQPLIKQAYYDEAGDRQVESLPVIPGCPVEFPTGGGFSVTYPLAVGDTGSLLFSGRSIDKWLAGTGQEVDPQIDHDHSLSDAKFVPGVVPYGKPRQLIEGANLVLGRAEGQIHVQPDGTILLHGKNAAQAFVLGNVYRTAEDTLFAALSTALAAAGAALTASGGDAAFALAFPGAAASIVTAGGALTGVASAFNTFLSSASNYLSTKVKGE